MTKFKKILCALPLIAAFSAANAAPVTDVRDYSTNTATTYFLDDDANKYNSPYYRGASEDWGWNHSAIGGTFSTASLSISAFDVDYDSVYFPPGERDRVSVWDGSTWFSLGFLAGGDNSWEFTTFDLTPYLGTWAAAQINAGLQVAMDIDTGNDGWIVTLAKSTLSVDGGSQTCVPQPGVPCTSNVPEPAGLALLGLGALGLFASRRRKAA